MEQPRSPDRPKVGRDGQLEICDHFAITLTRTTGYFNVVRVPSVLCKSFNRRFQVDSIPITRAEVGRIDRLPKAWQLLFLQEYTSRYTIALPTKYLE